MDLTRNDILHCVCNSVPKLKAVILIILTSGMSVGELIQLRLFDIDFTTTPTKILVRKCFSKNRSSRQTFITEEATKILQEFLRKEFGWHPNSLNLDLSGIYIFGSISVQKGDPNTVDVEVSNESDLVVLQGATLDIDFMNKFLKIIHGSRVIIKSGGTIT